MDNIVLSFLIPVYNVEKYVEECLDSILMQGLLDNQYEIICVNDGSTDDSADIIFRKQQIYGKVIQLINTENGGASRARNIALRAAHGKYVWFIDADDFIEPGSAKVILNQLEKDNLDFLSFGIQSYNPNRKKQDIDNCLHKPTTIVSGEDYLKNYAVERSCCTFVFRRDIAINNDVFLKEGITMEDYEFPPHLLLFSQRIAALPKIFYNYRYNPQSTSKGQRTLTIDKFRIGCYLEILDLLHEYELNIAKDKNCLAGFKGLVAYHMFAFVGHSFLSSRKKQALASLFYSRGFFKLLNNTSKLYTFKSQVLASLIKYPFIYRLLLLIK